ncbi:hypothetical protein N7532_007001, partial [Penicillium argentinense]
VNGQVLAQERLLGAKKILHQLHNLKSPEKLQARSYVVPGPNILVNGRISPSEEKIPFSGQNDGPDLIFMHNNVATTNCIIDNVSIVELIDLKMAGSLGWRTVGIIHRRIITP